MNIGDAIPAKSGPGQGASSSAAQDQYGSLGSPLILDNPGEPGGLIYPCKFCGGSGSVQDVSKWPPVAPCPGCHGAGVHRV